MATTSRGQSTLARNTANRSIWRCVCIAALVALGCESGMNVPLPGGDGGGTAARSDVDASLQSLGVNTDPEPRVDDAGDELPEDYSPLGSQRTFGQTQELFIAGMQLKLIDPAGNEDVLTNRAAYLELTDDATAELELAVDTFAEGQAWESDTLSGHPGFNGYGGQTARSAAAGDVDGDGRDEVLVAYAIDSEVAGANRVFVEVLNGKKERVGETVLIGDYSSSVTLTIEAGDVDGDGDDDMVLAIASDGAAIIHVLINSNGELVQNDSLQRELEPFSENSNLSVELALGNIDRDNGQELVVIINEFEGDASQASYTIFDDAKTEMIILDAGPVAGRDGQLYAALVADVALGDIDADGKDEIVMAGLTEFRSSGCDSYSHIHVALDDAANGDESLKPIGALYLRDTYVASGTGCNSNSHYIRARFLHVNTLDVDGDGIAEVHAGRRVFDDWTNADPWTVAGDEDAPWQLPHNSFLKDDKPGDGGLIGRATSAVACGDVTGDGRDDLVLYFQWRDEIEVWGVVGPDESTWEWKKIQSIATEFYNGQDRVFPLIVSCNIDSDGVALRYSDAEYRLVFTEPIIIAALAAAPCDAGIAQNIDACRTTFGGAETQRAGIDGTVSVRASTFVGGKVEAFGFAAEVKSTVTKTASFSASRAYELEQTIEYTTGPMEDTVIFTTLPIDQYTYTVQSHPDPEMIGEQIIVNMPRTPITLQVERSFYNANTPADAFKVGANVFLHTPGDVMSYPTEADADTLIDTGGLGHLGPAGELVDAAGNALGPIADRLLGRGLKSNRSVAVGATNGGESSIEIAFTESTGYRAGAEIDYELSAETSAPGVTVGGSVGASVEAGLSWGTSQSTIYRGTVGDIAPSDFGEHRFSYGLFTYIYNYGDASKQQFEVINYWVE